MRKFIFRIVLFASLLLFLLSFTDQHLPFYWGNEGLSTKMQYIEQENFKYNTYFIGSSRMYRHLIPSLFDSLNNGVTHTFNLGYSATKPPETYYFLDRFLDLEQPNTRYIFLELGEIQNLEAVNRMTLRSKYYLDIEHWWLAISSHWNNKKPRIAINYTMSYLSRLLRFDMVRPAFFYPEKSRIPNALGIHEDGHCSLEKEQHELGADNEFSRRFEKFKADTSTLTNRKKQIAETYKSPATLLKDKANLNKIQDLVRKAKAKGIRLILIKLPRSTDGLSLYQALDADKIDLCNPEKYPAFYSAANSFDVGHFNVDGAKTFTSILVSEFGKLRD